MSIRCRPIGRHGRERVFHFEGNFQSIRSARLAAYGLSFALLSTLIGQSASAEEAAAPEAKADRRQIEEVVVTAERKEASISDTSISITAFTGQMLEDFGIRNAEDLQNMIPAAVIQPYDMAIRGIGRNFRNLGGDPGIATYANSVYSEDFGIASSEGGLFDIERVEVLRGPQGTLYGRNAIGGAVNFINKKPTDEFEGEAKVITGSDGLQEEYGMLSGPIIGGILDARLTGVKRVRDGAIKDLSGNQDPDNFGDENYSLALQWTPSDDITWLIRGNERSLRRRMGGADAAGIITFSENGDDHKNARDTSTYAFGFRAVDPSLPCPSQFARTAVVAAPGVRGGVGCMAPGIATHTFTNPTDGSLVTAQYAVPGVDSAKGTGTSNHPNYAYGADPSKLKVLGFDNLKGGDLTTDTNGLQNEGFDQQAGTSDISWQVNDKVTLKYIFGYSSFFYDRNTDVDLTSSTLFDNQFYVSQEAEYVSHELQAFTDFSDNFSLTSGLFYYDSKITQRGDFYDSLCVVNQPCSSRYANPAFGTAAAPVPYGAIDPGLAFLDAIPQQQLFSAKQFGLISVNGGQAPGNCIPGLFEVATSNYCYGAWQGNTKSHVAHQNPFVSATDLQYQTRSERNSYAAYTQGVYTFNEHFALTLGARWARDQLTGEENLGWYAEDQIATLGFNAAAGTPCTTPGVGSCTAGGTVTTASSLAAVNQAFGYLAADGTILNPQRLLPVGVPVSVSAWRREERKDDDITWRANLDWTPTDNDLIYISATKGSRAGGFNLVFFSANRAFKTESLISYELGYKGTLRDGTMQLNSAVYLYDYKNVETFGTGPSLFNPANTSTSVFSVPSAQIVGWDTDLDWLITDNITLGANFSYTHSEYTDHFTVNDPNDPSRPPSLFDPLNIPIDLDGKQMLQVPEMKGGIYAQYTWQMADRGQITFLANWSWIDQVYFSAFESKEDAAPSYQRTDLRATWISPSSAWTVAAFADNVFDEIGLRQVDHYGSTEDVNFRRSGSNTIPQQLGISVDFKFGALK